MSNDVFFNPALNLDSLFPTLNDESFLEFLKEYYKFLQSTKITLENVSGTFVKGETVVGFKSKAFGTVLAVGENELIVLLKTEKPLDSNETITGSISGASGRISNVKDNVIRESARLKQARSQYVSGDEFFQLLKDEVNRGYPSSSESNRRALYNRIRELFESKSTEEAYRFLFKAFFNENVQIRFPGDDLLRVSDGKFEKTSLIRVIPQNTNVFPIGTIFDFLNKTIRGQTSGAVGTVVNIQITFLGGIRYAEFNLKLVSGEFIEGETVSDVLQPRLSTEVFGVVGNIRIIDGGSGYSVQDEIIISGDGSEATAVVSSISEGPINRILINVPGFGYRLDTRANINNIDSGGDGLSIAVTEIANTYSVTRGSNTYILGDTSKISILNRGSGYVKTPIITLRDTTIQSLGLLSERLIRIDNSGENYAVGDVLTFTGGAGTNAAGIVAAVGNTTPYGEDNILFEDDFVLMQEQEVNGYRSQIKDEDWTNLGSILRIELTNLGDNYTSANLPTLTIEAGNTVSGSNAAFTVQNIQGVSANVVVDIANNSVGIGSIRQVDIINPGINFTNATASASTRGDGNASLVPEISGLYVNRGFFTNDDGKVNIKTIQDSLFFQDFSYVIRSGLIIDAYKELIKETVHPAGLEFFGEIVITSIISLTANFISEIRVEGAEPGEITFVLQSFLSLFDAAVSVPPTKPSIELEIAPAVIPTSNLDTFQEYNIEITPEKFTQPLVVKSDTDLSSVNDIEIIRNITLPATMVASVKDIDINLNVRVSKDYDSLKLLEFADALIQDYAETTFNAPTETNGTLSFIEIDIEPAKFIQPLAVKGFNLRELELNLYANVSAYPVFTDVETSGTSITELLLIVENKIKLREIASKQEYNIEITPELIVVSMDHKTQEYEINITPKANLKSEITKEIEIDIPVEAVTYDYYFERLIEKLADEFISEYQDKKLNDFELRKLRGNFVNRVLAEIEIAPPVSLLTALIQPARVSIDRLRIPAFGLGVSIFDVAANFDRRIEVDIPTEEIFSGINIISQDSLDGTIKKLELDVTNLASQLDVIIDSLRINPVIDVSSGVPRLKLEIEVPSSVSLSDTPLSNFPLSLYAENTIEELSNDTFAKGIEINTGVSKSNIDIEVEINPQQDLSANFSTEYVVDYIRTIDLSSKHGRDIPIEYSSFGDVPISFYANDPISSFVGVGVSIDSEEISVDSTEITSDSSGTTFADSPNRIFINKIPNTFYEIDIEPIKSQVISVFIPTEDHLGNTIRYIQPYLDLRLAFYTEVLTMTNRVHTTEIDIQTGIDVAPIFDRRIEIDIPSDFSLKEIFETAFGEIEIGEFEELTMIEFENQTFNLPTPLFTTEFEFLNREIVIRLEIPVIDMRMSFYTEVLTMTNRVHTTEIDIQTGTNVAPIFDKRIEIDTKSDVIQLISEFVPREFATKSILLFIDVTMDLYSEIETMETVVQATEIEIQTGVPVVLRPDMRLELDLPFYGKNFTSGINVSQLADFEISEYQNLTFDSVAPSALNPSIIRVKTPIVFISKIIELPLLDLTMNLYSEIETMETVVQATEIEIQTGVIASPVFTKTFEVDLFSKEKLRYRQLRRPPYAALEIQSLEDERISVYADNKFNDPSDKQVKYSELNISVFANSTIQEFATVEFTNESQFVGPFGEIDENRLGTVSYWEPVRKLITSSTTTSAEFVDIQQGVGTSLINFGIEPEIDMSIKTKQSIEIDGITSNKQPYINLSLENFAGEELEKYANDVIGGLSPINASIASIKSIFVKPRKVIVLDDTLGTTNAQFLDIEEGTGTSLINFGIEPEIDLTVNTKQKIEVDVTANRKSKYSQTSVGAIGGPIENIKDETFDDFTNLTSAVATITLQPEKPRKVLVLDDTLGTTNAQFLDIEEGTGTSLINFGIEPEISITVDTSKKLGVNKSLESFTQANVDARSIAWGDLRFNQQNLFIATIEQYQDVVIGSEWKSRNVNKQLPLQGRVSVVDKFVVVNLFFGSINLVTNFESGDFVILDNEKFIVKSVANSEYMEINVSPQQNIVDVVPYKEFVV